MKYLPKYYNYNPKIPRFNTIRSVDIVDESLRDGFQGAIKTPSYEERVKYIDYVSKIGVKVLTVGIFTGDKGKEKEIVDGALAYMAENYSYMIPVVLVRTLKQDINWAIRCSRLNNKLEVLVFMGSSPPRLWVENWEEKQVLQGLGEGIEMAKAAGVKVIAATEDTTRTKPDFLNKILKIVVKKKADSFCIADTVGTMNPKGVFNMVRHARKELNRLGGEKIGIEFHGHNDLGLAVANSIQAVYAGANRVHGVMLGYGERSGNTDMGALMVNIDRDCCQLKDECREDWDLTQLIRLANYYAKIVGISIPHNAPIYGKNAATTQAGIHSRAIERMMRLVEKMSAKKNEKTLRKIEKIGYHIYTSVDLKRIGREYEFQISPMSGISTVKLWLKTHDDFGVHVGNSELISSILELAKETGKILSQREIIEVIDKYKEK